VVELESRINKYLDEREEEVIDPIIKAVN